ncbi:DUF1302 family protein [Candidatus Manganitrophus noduliformans]|uniref:DUF1302 family protein n=1 Tax=Candidatus Manganitrophus noduliformans TaxID=2606439 RepID=UPI002A4E2CA0|nr:DUF1302 family protein [Candidatus Manganitrophus noduliformans]
MPGLYIQIISSPKTAYRFLRVLIVSLLWLAFIFILSRGIVFAQDVEDIFPSIKTLEQNEKPTPPPPETEKGTQDRIEKPAAPPSPLFNRLLEKISDDLTWGGYLRNETSFRYVSPTGFDKILNILHLEGRYRLAPRIQVAGRLRAFYDAVYNVESIDVISPRKGPDTLLVANVTEPDQVRGLDPNNVRDVHIVKSRIELKELYLDINFQNFDLRIGRQIVRWGVVEGARVTDEINPLDFYELILRDIDDRYIPLFMIKGDLYLGSNTFEGIIIPEVRGHRPAPKGSQWEQFRLLPNLEKPEQPYEDFPNNIENTEIALKYTRVFSGFELSASYFYTWDDFPSSFRSIAGSGEFALAPTVDFIPKYNRLHIYGTTYSKTFPGFVFNAEAAYVDGKVFGARFGDGSSVQEGEIQKNYVKYAVGLDLYILGMDVSPAAIQQYIIDYDHNIIQDRVDTVGAVFIRKEFIHNLWTGNLLVLYFFNDEDWLIRPRTFYNITDRLRVSFGVDIFEGKIGTGLPGEFHFVGFFDNNDRIFWDITYSF